MLTLRTTEVFTDQKEKPVEQHKDTTEVDLDIAIGEIEIDLENPVGATSCQRVYCV